jgi:hypothetical protein
MNTCVICGKLAEGTTIEIDDENLEPLEKYVCNSCSEVIAEIAFQTVHRRIQSLVRDVEQLKKFSADFERKYPEGSNFQGRVSKVERDASDLDDLSSEDEESQEDEEFEDDPFSKDIKAISDPPTEALADQLLSFAKEISLGEDLGDLLSHNVVELYWKSKGLRSIYAVSPENSIKMKQVESMARDNIIVRRQNIWDRWGRLLR